MTPGFALILLSALFAVVAFVSAVGWAKGQAAGERAFRLAYGAMTVALAAAAVLLMRAILTHDFRYDYVIGYSSRDLPPVYLVSAFWGGQEGTYLLWALLGALLGYALFRRGAWRPGSVMAAYVPTIGILISFMLNSNGNPFRLAPHIPPDGRGLNPLLQDPWMATHPPVVFLGYAAMTIPAVLAWVAAIHREEKRWVADGLRFTLLGFVTLGVGIILGGVWAYKVLGWGGFWGWDPVENASLIPWIVGAALLHGLLVQQATGALRRTNLVLAMAAYLLVIYSTFLTRSGVLADFSVHSFPKGSIYGLLVGALVLVAGFSVYTLMRWRAPEGSPMQMTLSWPLVLTATIVLFSISAFLVLIGTSWPILSSLVGKPSTPTAPFYNEVNLPFYILLLAILGLGPFLAWASLPRSVWIRRFLPSAVLALLGTVVAALLGGHGVSFLLLFYVALLALFSNVARLIEVGRRRILNTGAAVSHIGFALMFVGIIAAECWDQSRVVELPMGRGVQVLGRTLTYEGHEAGSQPKDRWKVAIETPGKGTRAAAVTFYLLDNGQTFKKPSILRGAFGDFYVAPNAILEADQGDEHLLRLTKNEPVRFGEGTLTFLRFDVSHAGDEGSGGMGGMGPGGMVVKAVVRLSGYGKEETLVLPLVSGEGGLRGTPVPVESLGGIELTLTGMSVEQGMITVETSGGAGGNAAGGASPGTPETLVAEVSTKPLIGLLWVGTALLALGCVIAFVRRTLEKRSRVAQAAFESAARGRKLAARGGVARGVAVSGPSPAGVDGGDS